jgi:hypothetical protein
MGSGTSPMSKTGIEKSVKLLWVVGTVSGSHWFRSHGGTATKLRPPRKHRLTAPGYYSFTNPVFGPYGKRIPKGMLALITEPENLPYPGGSPARARATST